MLVYMKGSTMPKFTQMFSKPQGTVHHQARISHTGHWWNPFATDNENHLTIWPCTVSRANQKMLAFAGLRTKQFLSAQAFIQAKSSLTEEQAMAWSSTGNCKDSWMSSAKRMNVTELRSFFQIRNKNWKQTKWTSTHPCGTPDFSFLILETLAMPISSTPRNVFWNLWRR